MRHQQGFVGLICACSLLGVWACERPSSDTSTTASTVVARFEGGVVTEEELLRESQRLPPHLRERFERGAGREEFIRSLVDKRLLAQEAVRQGFTNDPEIRRQVRELEERLSIQALLAKEEQAVAAPSEAEARAYYESHLERFAEPERLRLAKIHSAVPAGSPRSVWLKAQVRAEGYRRRLLSGEAVGKVASEGDGPERTRGGELGLLARGEFGGEAVEKAALSLTKPGAVSGVVEEAGGVSVLVLLERRPARVPPFEEVKSAVLGQMAPGQQRRVFEQVLKRLRAAAAVQVQPEAAPAAGGGAVARQ